MNRRNNYLFLGALVFVSCSHGGSKPNSQPAVTKSQSVAAVSNPQPQPSAPARKPKAVSTGKASQSGYKLRDFQETVLENGLRVLFVPDDSLPFVSYTLMVKVGAIEDPEGLSGLSSMVAELLDKGTKKRTATQIASDFGQMGADFGASASTEFTILSASGLSTQADQLLGNLFEVVTEPTFSDSEIERSRQQTLSSIDRLQDNPEAFSALSFERFLYVSHPYARPALGSLESVATIKKKHIIQHYLRYYRPNNSILAVVGKITPELTNHVTQLMSGWAQREMNPVLIGPPPPISGLQFELVDKPGMVQSQIHIGSLGIARKDPDFLTLRVANAILGGGYKSRLIDRIRVQLGLTYSVSSSFDPLTEQGPFEIGTFTKNETVGTTIDEILKVLNLFVDKGVTDAEVDQAKGYLKGVFPTAIETPEKLALNLLMLRFYGIPDTYLTGYLQDIEQITRSQVNAAIKRHIHPENLKILVYSTASEVTPQLENVVKSVGGQALVTKSASELK